MATISGNQLKPSSVKVDKLDAYSESNGVSTLALDTDKVTIKDTLEVGSPVLFLGKDLGKQPSFFPMSDDAGILVKSSMPSKYNGIILDVSEYPARWKFVQDVGFSSNAVTYGFNNIADLQCSQLYVGNVTSVGSNNTIAGFNNIGTDSNIATTIGNGDKSTVNTKFLSYTFRQDNNYMLVTDATSDISRFTVPTSNVFCSTYLHEGDFYVTLPNAYSTMTTSSGSTLYAAGLEITIKAFGTNKRIDIKVADYVNYDGTHYEHFIDLTGGQTGIHIVGNNPCVTLKCIGSITLDSVQHNRWITLNYSGTYDINN